MEQVESIPFSTFIAGMLLCKMSYNSTEVVNIISRLEGQGIMIDDENDSMDELACCIEMSPNYDFCLKKGLGYDTILSPGVTVFKFLMIHADERILSFLNNYSGSNSLQQKIVEESLSQEVNSVHKGFFGIKRKILTKKKLPIHDMARHDLAIMDRSTILG